MSKLCIIFSRNFSLSCVSCGKRNFRKFDIPERGTEIYKERQRTNPDSGIPVKTFGVRDPGLINEHGEYEIIPEKIPDIIVPDLTGFSLKPYVSYRVADIEQPEFTARDLFDVVYAQKIENDFRSSKLDEKGNPIEPSEEELITPENAKLKAKQTGTDIFAPPSKREIDESYMTNY